MGFWQGVANAYKDIKAEETREREIEEERAFQRETFRKRILEERKNALIPALIEQRKAASELAEQRATYGNWFRGRLEGVDEATSSAYVNLATSNPTVAESLIKSVTAFEQDNNLRIQGTELIKFANIIEQTKPEEMSTEDWIEQASTSLTPSATGGVDFETTLSKILAGETQEDLYRIQEEMLTMPSPTVDFVPDVDVTGIVGIEPATQENLTERAQEVASTVLEGRLEELSQELAAEPGKPVDPSIQEEYDELTRLKQRENPGLILERFAPQVIPKLAENEPLYKRLYPEYFQEAEVTQYEWVNGELVPVED